MNIEKIELYSIHPEKDQKKYANVVLRITSLIIDIIILSPIILFNFYNISFLKNSLYHILMIVFLVIYKLSFEHFLKGTPGKKILKLKIVNKDLKKINFNELVKRNILFLLFLFCFLVDGLLIINNQTDPVTLETMISFSGLESIFHLFLVGIHFIYIISYFIIMITPFSQSLSEIYSKTFCTK